MFKKFLVCLLSFYFIIPIFVYGSDNYAAKVGDRYYDTLEEAIANASSDETIMLTSNYVFKDTMEINKTVNLNLNGHDITASEMVFLVSGGVLNVSGEGTIRETDPNYGAIVIKGSSNGSDSNYSIVNVSKDVTLEGWSGIFINHDSGSAYGVVVNLDGKVNAVDDINGGNGVGVYVNGNIKHQNNAPVVNISDNAEIISSGNGLYIAGYSIFNIGKAYISGVESGIGIKAGILNIDGATVECSGDDTTPTEGYNNGIKSSGAAIQIESNSGYAGNMEINIDSGKFRSKKSNVIYEYIGAGNSSLVNSIDIYGGTFNSDAKKDVFLLSDSFKNKHNSFISGGTYTSDPGSYLKSGYKSVVENDLFKVVKSTLKEVDSDSISASDNGSNSFLRVFVILIVIIGLVIITYINRRKIFKIFNN